METTVSLVQMLDARERRVQRQQELLARYPCGQHSGRGKVFGRLA